MAMIIAVSCAATAWIASADLPEISVSKNSAGESNKPESVTTDTKPVPKAIWNSEALSFRFQGPPKPEEQVKPAVAAIVPVVVVPPIPLQLTGTILEDGNRFAVLRDNSGQEFVVREGEQVPAPHTNITVKSVAERSAKFGISGTEQELTLKTPNFELLFP